MSNYLAIAAVTSTIRNLLQTAYNNSNDADVTGTSVTTLPPDMARNGVTSNQVNLFLYHTAPNAAWRNMDVPVQVKPGETAFPPLALNLYYLITAYGQTDDTLSHRLMGVAMSVLHDHTVLGPDEIETALPGSGLPQQFDRVRITPETLTSEEMYKLWSAFQTHYRISATYQARVVLIDSAQPVKRPLPVASRGAAALPSFLPALDLAQPASQQQSVKLGDILTLKGHNLGGVNATVQINYPSWASPVVAAPEAGATADQLSVKVGDPPGSPPVDWPAGFYSVAVSVQSVQPDTSHTYTSNLLSFSLAPSITVAPTAAPAGDVIFTVTCSPDIFPGQQASFLIGDTQVPAGAVAAKTSTLTLVAKALTKGDYYVRLRVDGVDSFLVDASATPPAFDQSLKVTIS